MVDAVGLDAQCSMEWGECNDKGSVAPNSNVFEHASKVVGRLVSYSLLWGHLFSSMTPY